jgi:hypothetical protein
VVITSGGPGGAGMLGGGPGGCGGGPGGVMAFGELCDAVDDPTGPTSFAIFDTLSAASDRMLELAVPSDGRACSTIAAGRE